VCAVKSIPSILATLIIVLVIVAALLLPGSAVSVAGEWEYRARMEFTGPLEDHLAIRMTSEVRTGSGLKTHRESHFDLGLEWAVPQWLGIAPYYRNVTQKKGSAWVVEHRPHLNLTFRWSALGMRFGDRSRLEYRMIESANKMRYRNRLMLSFRPGWIPRLSPHLSSEPYYDFDAGEINKNRLIAGFDLKLRGPASLKIEYVLDSVKRPDRWHEVNSLLVALKYKPKIVKRD
jgi:hypothetical protein